MKRRSVSVNHPKPELKLPRDKKPRTVSTSCAVNGGDAVTSNRMLSLLSLPVHQALCEWSQHHMTYKPAQRFSSTPPLEIQDYKGLCYGQNSKIWRWMFAHINSTAYTEDVRGNLTLARKSAADTTAQELSALSREIEELESQVTNTESAITHCDNDVMQLQQDALAQKQEVRDLTSSTMDNYRRAELLKQAAKKINLDIEELQRMHNNLQTNIKHISHQNCTTEMKDMFFLVDEIVSVLSSHILSACYADERGVSVPEVDRSANQCYVECNPLMAVRSLIDQTYKAIQAIKEDNNNNTREDVTGGCDLPSTSSLINQLIKQRTATYIKTKNCSDTRQQYLNSTHSLLNSLKLQLKDVHDGNEDLVNMVLELINKDSELVGLRAYHGRLQELCHQLEEEGITSQHITNTETYAHNIQQHHNTISKNYEIMKVLINGANAVFSHCSDMQKLIVNTLSDGAKENPPGVEQAKDWIQKELSLFSMIPMQALDTTLIEGKKVRCIEMGINRLASSQYLSGSVVVDDVMSRLSLPPHTSTHTLLSTVQDINIKLSMLNITQHRLHKLHTQYNSNLQLCDNKHIQDLTKEVESSNAAHRVEVQPILESCTQAIDDMTTSSQQLNTVLKDWKEQPAQNLDVDVTVNNRTLKDLQREFKLLVTQRRAN